MSPGHLQEQPSPITPETLCPTSGEICPARALVVALYTEKIDPAISLSPENSPVHDGAKMNVKLLELKGRAQLANCEGPEDATCPVRLVMDESKGRQKIVNGIRNILKVGRGNT